MAAAGSVSKISSARPSVAPPAPLPLAGLIFVSTITTAGLAVLVYSVGVIWRSTIPAEWVAFAAFTIAAGALSLKIPSVQSRFSVSAVFAITSVLLFGPEVGAVVLALDGLRLSLRWKMNRMQTAFNLANLALAIWISSRLFFSVSGLGPLHGRVTPPATVVFHLMLMTVVYFAINTGLTAGAVALTGRRTVRGTWVEHYWPLFPSYLAGSSVALLLVLAFREVHFTAVALIVPLLVICYLTLQSSFARLEDARSHVEEVNRLLLSTVETLATAIDAKDEITHDHVRRVQQGTMELARLLGVTDPSDLQAIEAAALLHDTGKIAVPEHILNKPGRLTPAEFEKMKRHAAIGAEILSSIDFPYPVVPIVRHHHENWDGTGYPDRLQGEAIPLGARILAVIDCYDALTSDRPYRSRMTDAQALAIVRERRGSMYDPAVVDAFLSDYTRIMPACHPAPHPATQAIGSARALDREERLVEGPLVVDPGMADGLLAVTSLSRALTGEARVADIGSLLWTILRQVLPCEAIAIFVPDTSTDTVAARYAAGQYASRLRGIVQPTGAGVAGWVAVTRRAAVNADPALDLGHDPREAAPLRSCLAIPIGVSTELTGVLALYRADAHAFTDDHVRLLELLAARVAAPLSVAITSDDEEAALKPAVPLALVRRPARVQG